ncbi:MAG: anti-phage dCTP deaminase [bacterium]
MKYNEENVEDPELIIALVGAIGSELQEVEKILSERLKVAAYEVHQIKVSEHIIRRLEKIEDFDERDEYSRIKAFMDAGDSARKNNDDNNILALGIAARISSMRGKNGPEPKPGNCYIVNSLKRPEEVLKLREIYPNGFYLVGVYSDTKRRESYLIENKRMQEAEAKELMKRDEDGESPYGQKVAETFHMSDFFVSSDDQEWLKSSLWRIVDILFGNPYITPTFDEYAMFLAYAASLSSGDLSRQVGAVVAKKDDILATGANDCPRYGGGRYWPVLDGNKKKVIDYENGRDLMRGYDSNVKEQEDIIASIINSAREKNIDPHKMEEVLEESRIRDITEYGRVVHAEMEALLSCARNNVSTRGATLYCTTFPCHNCAKHIIAAGISRVVYVEPYQKSKATDFHDDSICLKMNGNRSLLSFESFIGVGPRRFFDLFSLKLGSGRILRRKNDKGEILDWTLEEARPRLNMQPGSYLDFELIANKQFMEAEKNREERDEEKG